MANELILIVEDNDKNRKLVRDVLQVKGYRVADAETGEEGVRLARELRPDLTGDEAAIAEFGESNVARG